MNQRESDLRVAIETAREVYFPKTRELDFLTEKVQVLLPDMEPKPDREEIKRMVLRIALARRMAEITGVENNEETPQPFDPPKCAEGLGWPEVEG